jgi:hypothetical protein
VSPAVPIANVIGCHDFGEKVRAEGCALIAGRRPATTPWTRVKARKERLDCAPCGTKSVDYRSNTKPAGGFRQVFGVSGSGTGISSIISIDSPGLNMSVQ